MWRLTRRSLVVNRTQLLGSLVALTASVAILTTGAMWLYAGFGDPQLQATSAQLATVAGSFLGLAGIIAGMTVASTVSAGLRERRRHFALLAAVGATRNRLRAVVATETLLLCAIATPLGALGGFALASASIPVLHGAGLVPDGYGLAFNPIAALSASGLMIVAALAATLWSARVLFRTQAASAVRTAGVEGSALGSARGRGAVVAAVAGISGAIMPLVLPGMIGVAFGTLSTFCFIAALALVGPAVAAGAARALTGIVGPRSRARLALVNVRGFSQRLTTVIVPFALVAALGAVQLSTNAVADTAAREQLASGLGSALVAAAASAEAVDAVAATPGVANVAVLGSTNGEVFADQDDEEPFEIWEPAAIGTLAAADPASAISPGVVSGDLARLAGSDTIAVSSDALWGTGAGLGSVISVRVGGVRTERAVVAVYGSSLGFGDYLISTDAAADGTLLVDADPADARDVVDAAAAAGVRLSEPGAFAAAGGDADTAVSSVLLFALLGFGLIAAVNTLVTLIRGRRDEYALLSRIGASRAVIVGTVVREAALAIAIAVIAGTLCAVPAAVGAGVALLTHWPALPWAALGLLPVLLGAIAVSAAAVAVTVAVRMPRSA